MWNGKRIYYYGENIRKNKAQEQLLKGDKKRRKEETCRFCRKIKKNVIG